MCSVWLGFSSIKGDPIEWEEEWLEGGLLARVKSPYLRGEEELHESSVILNIFQIVVRH